MKIMPVNLYLISQTVNDDWDTFSDCVVAALTEAEAKRIHPRGDPEDTHCWAPIKDVKVKLLGRAEPGIEPGTIICTSFHAG